jgi:small conductance mechanosensitive channel
MLVLRAYTNSADGWGAQTDLLRALKERFDAEGISLGAPQQAFVLLQGRSPEQTT